MAASGGGSGSGSAGTGTGTDADGGADAVETLDATYFATYTQFRKFLAWEAERAMGLYQAGAVLPSLAAASQDAYLTAWKTSADGKALRNFARRTWSAAYVTKVREIAAATE